MSYDLNKQVWISSDLEDIVVFLSIDLPNILIIKETF